MKTAGNVVMVAGVILAVSFLAGGVLLHIRSASITKTTAEIARPTPAVSHLKRKFLVRLFSPQERTSLQEAEKEQHACEKAGWDLSAPCVVMDVTKPLSDRTAAINEFESLHREISMDQAGEYVILGPAPEGKIRVLAVTRAETRTTSGYTACLRAGWGPEDCKLFDLKVIGLAIDAMALIRKSIERDGPSANKSSARRKP